MGVRQLVPEGLAEVAPGPELARILAGVELSRLSGFDCVEILKAQYRQANHERARVMAAMVEVGLCGIGPDDELPRRAVPDEFSADEVRAALVLTRRAADAQFGLAYDLVTRLPQVYAAMDAGALDEPRARVLSEWTAQLSPEQARAVCAALLPQASRLTTGQLIEQIKKWAIAVDPEWARRRYEQAIAERKVVGYRNADGSANLSGYNLPVDRVAAASGRIDALAKAVKRAGDRRILDHIRADLFLGMTDGSYTGLTDAEIIELLTTTPVPDTDQPNDNSASTTDNGDDKGPDTGPDGSGPDGSGPDGSGPDGSGPDGSGPDGSGPDGSGPDGSGPDGSGPDGSGPDGSGPDDSGPDDSGLGATGGAADGGRDKPAGDASVGGELVDVRPADDDLADGASTDDSGDCRSVAAATRPNPIAVGTGLELRVRLSTLLGHDQYPAELAGWGPLHADLARDLATTLGGAQWRFAITDDDGQLISCGTTRARPSATPTRTAACRAIVELQVPATALRALATDPTTPTSWADVITDLLRHLDHDTPDHSADAGRRAPGAALRRYLEIRDRYCTMIGCRAPAHTTDQDHTIDHAHGGPTTGPNLGGACRHDHRLKTDGGWTLHQPHPGVFHWTSRLGHSYQQHPPAIIEPLPDPIPREQPPYPLTIPPDDGWADTDIWENLLPDPEPDPPPEPDPSADIPPF